MSIAVQAFEPVGGDLARTVEVDPAWICSDAPSQAQPQCRPVLVGHDTGLEVAMIGEGQQCHSFQSQRVTYLARRNRVECQVQAESARHGPPNFAGKGQITRLIGCPIEGSLGKEHE